MTLENLIIKITADVQQVKQAFKSVQNEANTIKNEFQNVSKNSVFPTGNVNQASVAYQALAAEITQVTAELQALQAMKAQADAMFARGVSGKGIKFDASKAYEMLQKQIDKTKDKQKKLNEEQEKMNSKGKKGIAGLIQSMKSFGKSADSTTQSVKKLSIATLAIGGVISLIISAVRKLISIAKEGIELASQLEEVQNVVEVSFGNMTQDVEEFSKKALYSLGMSELTAKKMASTFMAMSNGMGIAAKDGRNMALQLTALAADMASFYNVSQDVAQTALNSIFTGETETLKKFGIVLTETNLKAFALSRGITKSYSSMTEAEKVALRYNYVLQATANAQGDFARTSGSWANQTRLLKEQLNILKTALGQILIAVILPLVKALNALLSFIISIGRAIGSLFGKKTGMVKTISDANTITGGLAGKADSVSDGFEKANQSAKKLQRTIAAFDELNVLNPKDQGSSSTDLSGGGGFDLGIPEYDYDAELSKANSFFDKLEQAVAKFFNKIKNSPFGQWLSATIKLIGQTFKNIYDTILKPIIENIGKSFSNLWNEHLKPFFGELGKLLGNIGIILLAQLDMFLIFINFLIDTFGPVISDIFNIVWNTIMEVVGNIIDIIKDVMSIFNGLIEFLTNVFTGQWEDALNNLVDIGKDAFRLLVDVIRVPVNIIIGILNTIARAFVEVVNWIVRAINKIHVEIPSWVPFVGGKSIGFNLREVQYTGIPYMANGGVVASPTLAMIGEYAGASSNPEIVTPQNILRETIDASNSNMVSALYQMCQQVIQAIDGVDMSVSIGDDVIAQSTKRGNDAYKKRTGYALI